VSATIRCQTKNGGIVRYGGFGTVGGMSDLFRDFARACARLAPLWLPGFAVVLVSAHFGHAALFDVPHRTFGGFLSLLLLLALASLLFGILVQSLRFVTFDLARGLVQERDPAGDSPEAIRYALYANLATLWGLLFLVAAIGHWSWWWDRPARVLFLLVFIIVEYGLIAGALHAYHATAKPGRRTKKKAT